MLRSASSSSGLLLPACLGGQFRDFRPLLRCQPVRPGRTALEATRPLWTRRSGVLGCARRDVDDELAQLIGIARPLLFRESRHDLIIAHPGGRAAGCTLQTRSLPTEPGEGEDRTSCRIPAGRNSRGAPAAGRPPASRMRPSPRPSFTSKGERPPTSPTRPTATEWPPACGPDAGSRRGSRGGGRRVRQGRFGTLARASSSYREVGILKMKRRRARSSAPSDAAVSGRPTLEHRRRGRIQRLGIKKGHNSPWKKSVR